MGCGRSQWGMKISITHHRMTPIISDANHQKTFQKQLFEKTPFETSFCVSKQNCPGRGAADVAMIDRGLQLLFRAPLAIRPLSRVEQVFTLIFRFPDRIYPPNFA